MLGNSRPYNLRLGLKPGVVRMKRVESRVRMRKRIGSSHGAFVVTGERTLFTRISRRASRVTKNAECRNTAQISAPTSMSGHGESVTLTAQAATNTEAFPLRRSAPPRSQTRALTVWRNTAHELGSTAQTRLRYRCGTLPEQRWCFEDHHRH